MDPPSRAGVRSKPVRRVAVRARRLAAWSLTLGLLAPARCAVPEADIRRDAVVEAVERVMPCVVNIGTEEIVEYRDPFEEMFREFYGPYYRRQPREARHSLGSGVIIDEEGYVLTNLHVVQRATKVWVQLSDGREFEARPIVGTTRTDVALLKLITPGRERFRAVKFARDDDLLLGETVLALGNPFGLGGSVSRGILSSKNRRPPLENETLEIADWLQTDAAVNPGSSGGPLINLRGELIGLSVAIYREGQGIGFAIPIKQVAEALSTIFTPEVQNSLWFGARIRSGAAALSVTSVRPASPAEKAGLRVGDQILQVNGRAPKDFIECTDLIGASPKGEATLVVQRGSDRRTLTVRLAPLADLVRQKLGLSLEELTPERAARLGFRPRDGLVVAEVEPDGPAARADLRAGWLITSLDGNRTPDLFTAADLLGARKKGDRVELGVTIRQQRGMLARVNQASVVLGVR
jgi:serine protease Do